MTIKHYLRARPGYPIEYLDRQTQEIGEAVGTLLAKFKGVSMNCVLEVNFLTQPSKYELLVFMPSQYQVPFKRSFPTLEGLLAYGEGILDAYLWTHSDSILKGDSND